MLKLAERCAVLGSLELREIDQRAELVDCRACCQITKWDIPTLQPWPTGRNIPFVHTCYLTGRRHTGGFHFATAVCERISTTLGIPFYADAVQCINRNRLDPDFHLLRPIAERRVIVYDDIITCRYRRHLRHTDRTFPVVALGRVYSLFVPL